MPRSRYGATVETAIPAPFIDDGLRRLEFHPGVHLVDRSRDPDCPAGELWQLRSLGFPTWWEGRRIRIVVRDGMAGFDSFELAELR